MSDPTPSAPCVNPSAQAGGSCRLEPVRAVFLDRDGVLNRNVFYADTGEYESPRSPDEVDLVPGAAAALARLGRAGFRLILVSNQPNAAKGKCTRLDLDRIHAALVAQLACNGGRLDACYYCFHHPAYTGPCACRKPGTRFLLEARARFRLELQQCWMIGDRPTDVACGQAAGVRTIRIHNVEEGPLAPEAQAPEFLAVSLEQAAGQVLAASPPAPLLPAPLPPSYDAAGRAWDAARGL